jgi:hypothetical protein
VSVSSTPGARESNAGDDFHILWAARRTVQLLNPRSSLFRVFMEGVSPSDLKVSSDEDLFLGVDLSEYYGGDDFVTSTRIVVSQLKYSTRHPNKYWTVSRLCEAKNKNKTDSVIKRLADIYKGFLASNTRENLIQKLSIRLVSNQPIVNDIQVALQAAQDFLGKQPAQASVQTAILLAQLSENNENIIKILHEKAGLKSDEFTDFLRVLDFNSFGEESRGFQRLLLIQELSSSVSNAPVSSLRSLCDLIRFEAQPEKERSIGLSAENVLACLGVGHQDNLLPSPSRLEVAQYPVETFDVKNLASVILSNRSGKILAHGNAGVGKTTSVQALSNHLPPGSVVIIYDCYGGGDYLIAGEQRHTHSRAFLQLTNELAVHCGTPFLVETAYEIPDIQRNFRKSLEMASKVIGSQDGLLVIAIDAGDNAIIAANASGNEKDCFVPALWTIPIPSNCRLLMTSRSHRRLTLKPSSEVTEHELQGFDKEASTAYLRHFYPDADNVSGAVFHERTNGNPRVQYYLLNGVETNIDDTVSLKGMLEASERTPNQIFADLLDAATNYSTHLKDSKQHLATLVHLTRPAPLHIFADVCGVSYEEAYNYCQALEPGLIIKNNEISFRDEDFETYLRDQIQALEIVTVQKRLGTYFLERANQDSYTARVVAEHLYQAELYRQLINLTVGGIESLIVEDEMSRLQIQRRRIVLAMRAACKLGLDGEAIRLTFLAAEISRSNGALTAIVRKNPELAALYGDTNNVARLYLREENNSWLGSVHLRTAAMYARNPAQRDRADENLRAAEAWIRRWAALPKNESFHWDINAFDMACGAEAVFWLNGAEAAQRWLSSWRPISAVVDAIEQLARSLAVKLNQEQQVQLFEQLKLPLWAKALFLAAFGHNNRKLSNTLVAQIEQTVEALAKGIEKGRKYKKVKGLWAVGLCEVAALNGLNAEYILQLTKTLCPKFPETLPYNHFDLLGYDLSLRTVCLQAVLTETDITTGDLLPDKYRKKEGQKSYQYDSDTRNFHDLIGKVLNVYKVRARTIVKQLTVGDVEKELTQELGKRLEESGHRWFKPDFQYQQWAEKACEALIQCSGDASSLLEKIGDAAEPIVRGASASLWIDMAKLLIQQETYRSLGYRLLERASHYIMEKPFPGNERWQTLLKCAAVVSQYDEEQGRDYYKRSLAAAEGIDDESIHLLSLQATFAHKIALSLSSEDRQNFALRLAYTVEAYQPYVSEASSLPWEKTLASVFKLDAVSGMALCSRWDDENRLQLEDGIIHVVNETTANSFFSPLEGLSLLRLAGERYDISKHAIELLEKLYAEGVKARPLLVKMIQEISLWIRRDVPLTKRKTAATLIVNWTDKYGMGQMTGIDELRELLSFVSSLPPEEKSNQTSSYRSEQLSDSTVREIVNSARNGLFDQLDVQLQEIWKQSYSEDLVLEYLRTLGQAVHFSQRVNYLNKLTSLELNFSLVNPIIEALKLYLQQWKGVKYIQDWIPTGISQFIENHLPLLLPSRYSYKNLEKVLSLPNLSEKTKAQFVLPAVLKHIEVLSPREFFSVAESLAASLPNQEVRDILDWSLKRTEVKLVRDGRNIAFSESLLMPTQPPALLANFFWSLFGHPDKRVRWRALHAARAIAKLPNQAFVDELVNLSGSETAGAFRSTQLEFYWMSARTWLMLLFQRLADECPEILQGHAQVIAQHALNRSFPHAQIREIAKRTALTLAEKIPSSLPSNILEQLHFANTPLACLYPQQDRYESRTSSFAEVEETRTKSRFSFNWTDTLPYWYAPASSVFGYVKPDVAQRAEKWICDLWGRTDQDWYNDARELHNEDQWQKMSNRHGTVPEFEKLRTYLEYHAMFCAAGEMIDELIPINGDVFDDVGCPWHDWLRSHLYISNDYWVTDLRTQTPYRLDCWGFFPPIKEWLQQKELAEFDLVLGLTEKNHAGEIVICGSIELYDSQRHGSLSITSALVNPIRARALLHALQTTDPNNFQLPVGNRGCGDFEIEEPGFELQSWLKDTRSSDESLDTFDPLRRNVNFDFETFKHDFVNTMKLDSMLGQHKYGSPNGKTAARLEIWSDNLEEDHISQAFSNGKRWWVSIEIILEYLQLRDRDLIIEVQLRHNRLSDQREEGEEYDLGKSIIYILHRDGTLETMDSCRDIRQADCARTGTGQQR